MPLEFFQFFGLGISAIEWLSILIPVLMITSLIVRCQAENTTVISPKPPVPAPLPRTVRPAISSHAPQRLSDQRQWQHVAAAEQTSLLRAAKAQQSHQTAARQLDAAGYELANIFNDLQTLMPQLKTIQRAHEHAPHQETLDKQPAPAQPPNHTPDHRRLPAAAPADRLRASPQLHAVRSKTAAA